MRRPRTAQEHWLSKIEPESWRQMRRDTPRKQPHRRIAHRDTTLPSLSGPSRATISLKQ